MRHRDRAMVRGGVVATWLAVALAASFSAILAARAEEPGHANVLPLDGQRRLMPSLVDMDESIRSTIQTESPRPVTFQAAWNVYAWPIVGSVAVALGEALLIGGLLVQRGRRRRAESALDERLRFETLLADLSAILGNLPAGEVERRIDRALGRLVAGLGVDRATLAEVTPDAGVVRLAHSRGRDGIAPAPATLEAAAFPWTVARARRGSIVCFARAEDLPPEAAVDRESYTAHGITSLVAVPLSIGGSVAGVLSCAHLGAEREWPDALARRLELLGGIFASALSRKQSETAVRESEDRFRLMADHAPVMVWMSNAAGRCTYLNDRWLAFTGRALAEEMGDGWADGVHPDDLEACLGVYRRAVEERRSFTMEYRLRRADGEYRWLLDHGVPRYARGDEFVGHIGSCVDTTELKAMQQAVQESKALASTIFTSLYGRVAAIDKDGVVIAVNESWERFARERGDDLGGSAVGDSYLEALRGAGARGDADARRALEAVESVLDRRAPQAVFEYARPSADGVRWYEMAVERLRRREGGAIISHVDVTPRRRAEEELRRQGEELAHALRVATMGELAGSLAHEINQPLAVVVTSAQAAQRLLESRRPDRAELRGALADIAEQGMHAARVIGRLRALFRKAEPERQRLDVAELIRGVASLVRHEVERRRIALTLRCPPELPAVSGDGTQLQQVVLNLLINACEAMAADEGPRELVVAVHAHEGGGIELTVEDSGPGLKEPERERIFEPFVTTKPAGLGMGLSISRSIIHAHGGRIWVACNPDRGITAHVELPAAEPAT